MFNSNYGSNGESKYNTLSNSSLVGKAQVTGTNGYIEDVVQVGNNVHHNLIDGNTMITANHQVLNIGALPPSNRSGPR